MSAADDIFDNIDGHGPLDAACSGIQRAIDLMVVFRIAAAGARFCVYGHLHRPQDWGMATPGVVDGVYYQLTSCDYLGFGPIAVRGLDRKPANEEGSIGVVYD